MILFERLGKKVSFWKDIFDWSTYCIDLIGFVLN